MSGIEIERKFLVKGSDYKKESFSSSRIKQGYICSGHGHTVRVRIRGDKGYITIKGASDEKGMSRYEFEKEITLEEAAHLMQLCEPGIIDKTRFLVKSGDHTFEVDEFYGDNEGLVMAEVELGSEDEPYEKPDFIGREVTGDHRFYNSHLRKMPFIIWKKTLPQEDLDQLPGAHL
jgi:CYTH domain-containing protein